MASMLPGGCTGLVQPLDIWINHPLKEIILQGEAEDYIDKQEEKEKLAGLYETGGLWPQFV